MMLSKEQLSFQIESGGSIPTSPRQFNFRLTSGKTANFMVTQFHYAHRAVPISWAFGCFWGDKCWGVLTIGKPASHRVCTGCCGETNESRVFELNRLWLDDMCPRNTESHFIGWVLKHLPKGIILVSYADTMQHHIGIIYQATNWIYTGITKQRTDIAPVEQGRHSRHYKKGGDYSVRQERSAKHRYVYFTDRKDRALLKWGELPYPSKQTQPTIL